MTNLNESLGFLIYCNEDNMGAIKLNSIKSIIWNKSKDKYLRLYINNILVYKVNINFIGEVSHNIFQSTIIDRILIHIRTAYNEDLNLNEMIKDV